MVDRGGLNYPIRVRDEFSATTALFREELRSAKAAFRDFQADLKTQRGSARALRDTAAAARDLAKAQQEQARASRAAQKPLTEEEKLQRELALRAKERAVIEREGARISARQNADARREAAARRAAIRAEEQDLKRQQQAIAAVARAEQQRQRLTARLIAAERSDREKADRLNAEVQAQRRITRELFQQQVALAQIQQLRTKARGQFAGGDVIGGRDTIRRARELEQSLNGSANAGSRLLFTFRRLIGVLAIFTLARRGVQLFQDLVSAGIRFNDTIEASTTGIAGLVATLGDVRNSFGDSVDSTEELNLALGIARDQVKKLRQDSLRTVATFEELLDTFQVAVGPGLAAGLDLDEIRKLTVDISQAASALGVPQNQLAEEVRSLLSGTIQARTTRIATALGITNADIRRLRETGELFDFLEERFSGFAAAAERQARTTLSGIRQLVTGATQELLGNAAQPLFEELLDLGNEFFDDVLTITDAAGNIKPNPEAVAAFRTLFEALRDGVQSARELAEEFGFEGLQNLVRSIATGLNVAIQAGIGAARVFGAAFNALAFIVREVTDLLGLSARAVGGIAAAIGIALSSVVLFRTATKLLGIEWAKVLSLIKSIPPAITRSLFLVGAFVAALGLLTKGFELIAEKIFGVELSLGDTVRLVGRGLQGAFFKVVEVVSVLGETISNAIGGALDKVIAESIDKAKRGRAIIASLFGDAETAERLADEQLKDELASDIARAKRREESEERIGLIRRTFAAKQLEIENEIAAIIGEAAKEDTRGAGFDPNFDAAKAAEDAVRAAQTFVSTADKPINELAESLFEVNKEIEKSRIQFDLATKSAGVGGFGGQVESNFNQQEVESAERLLQIRSELAKTGQQIDKLISDGVQKKEEGELLSLLRDEEDLREAINLAVVDANRLALTRSATEAATLLPTLRQENQLLQAQVASERAVTAAQVARLGPQQQALIAAQAAVGVAEAERNIARQTADAEIRALQARISAAPAGAEAAALQAVLEQLTTRRDLEQEILDLRIQQLEAAKREAELVANGSLTQGLREGFKQFAEEFSSTFQAGVEITKQSTAALASFISQSIVDAFDPTKDQTLLESFARFMQQVAQIILNQLIQLAIAKAILRLGFSEGGEVPASFRHGGEVKRTGRRASGAHAHAQGLAAGGRPAGISPLDTVPAWLRPGEFVFSKEAVDSLGLGTLEAMNKGNFPVTASSSAQAAAPKMGMRTGGLVADRLETARSAGGQEGGATVTVVPAVVARDREMDQLAAGGRNALLAFMRENGGSINAILDRSVARR